MPARIAPFAIKKETWCAARIRFGGKCGPTWKQPYRFLVVIQRQHSSGLRLATFSQKRATIES